jgi:hypothetical protein
VARPTNPSDVIVANSATGAAVDVNTVTQAGTGTAVEREVVNIGDPNDGGSVQSVNPAGEASVVEPTLRETMQAVLTEMRINNEIVNSGLGLNWDLDSMRSDPTYNGPAPTIT